MASCPPTSGGYLPPMGVDEAALNVSTIAANFSIQLLTQSAECNKCPLLARNIVGPHSSESLTVNTTFATLIQVLSGNGDIICEQTKYKFGEWGEYLLRIIPDELGSNINCTFEIVKEPVRSDLYNVWAALFFFCLALVYFVGTVIYRRYVNRLQVDERLLVSELGSPSERSGSSHIWSFTVDGNLARLRERLHSLDTFRGICIVMMIFVNYGGGKYWYFEHSKWNGLTVADLVFPWFLWIMGVSIALSIQSQLRRVVPRKRIFMKIVRRATVLFSLQLMLNSKYDLGCELADMRIMGVLQRFSLSYLVVATVHLMSESPADVYQLERWAPLRDIIPHWYQWIFMSLVVAGHTLLTFQLHVPDCPTGYLGPGGLHMNESYSNCTGGAAGYIDRLIIGERHLLQKPTFKNMYETTQPYDPEGLLGYLTSILVVFLGLQAGKILVMFPMYTSRVKRWIFWAVLTGGVGAILCQLSQNDGWIPINKNLWSMSFVLVTSSLAFVGLTVCYLLVDVLHLWTGSPFYYAGMNAILLYVGHELTQPAVFPWSFPVPDTHAYHLAMDVWGTSLWVVIAAWLYHCNFFLSV